MCREEQKMPSKSHIAFALAPTSAWQARLERTPLRFGVYVIKETPSIVLVEDPRETPWMLLEWLDVLDLNEENIARLGRLDLEWAGQIVDLGQVDILHIVGAIIVLDLAACPIETFNFDHFVVLDRSAEGDYGCVSIGCSNCTVPYCQDAICSETVLLAFCARVAVFREAHMEVGLISRRFVKINLEGGADCSRHFVSESRRSI
jgi:hypothetical protein